MPRPVNDQWGFPLGSVTVQDSASGFALPVQPKSVSGFTRASAAATASGNTGDIDVSLAGEIAVDASVTAVSGTTPSMVLVVERKGADGVYYPIWTSAAITANGLTSITVGPGCEIPKALGTTCRVSWTITGTTPSFTFSLSVMKD